MLRKIRVTIFAFACCLSFLFVSIKVNAQFSTVGTAVPLGGNCYRIVDQSQTASKGAIWNNTQINLNNGFDITFHVNIIAGPSGVTFSADGIAFVLQNTGLAATCAAAGNTLGYANSSIGPPCPGPPGVGGITPSLAVELDIFDNNQANTCIPEMASDHLAIVRNGIFNSPIFGPVCAFPVCGTTVEAPTGSNACRTLRIVYTPTSANLLQVYYNGVIRISTNYDIIGNVFGGSPNVYFGITGSDGGLTSTQIICWEFANAGPDSVICSGSPLALTGSGGTTYGWSPGGSLSSTSGATVNFTNTFTGLHPVVLTATNTYGCVDRDTVNVTVEANPVVNPGGPVEICIGDSIMIGPANNSNFSYSWSPAAGLSSTTIAQPMASPATTTNYTLTVTDNSTAQGCQGTATVQVTVNLNPIVFPGNDTAVCAGNCAPLGTTGSGSYSYLWSPISGGINPNIADPVSCPTVTTTYTLTVEEVNTGCIDSASVTITVNPLPIASIAIPLSDTSVCLGMSVPIFADSSGGDGFTWTPPGTLTGTNTLSPVATPIVTTEYFFTVTNSVTGCSATDSITIIINIPDPVTITSNDTFICNVDTIQLNSTSGSGIDQWSWVPTLGLANANSPSTTAFPTTSTTYVLTGTNSSTGCQAVDSVRIDVFELNLTGLANDSICRGDTVTLNVTPNMGSGNYLFDWVSPSGEWISDTSIGNPQVSPLTSTFYLVTVTDLTSTCSDQGMVFVTVSELQASVTPTIEEINPGQYVQLHASDGDFYVWTPTAGLSCIDCQDPFASPTTTTTYVVTISDSTGCSGDASTTIVVDSMIAQNVFTPNGDGVNDVLFFNYLGTGEYEVFVYDRWGVLIFSTNNPTQSWNGKTRGGQDVAEGVYYVLLKLSDDDAIPDTMKNTAWSVTLIR